MGKKDRKQESRELLAEVRNYVIDVIAAGVRQGSGPATVLNAPALAALRKPLADQEEKIVELMEKLDAVELMEKLDA